jgi:hypothetical protein
VGIKVRGDLRRQVGIDRLYIGELATNLYDSNGEEIVTGRVDTVGDVAFAVAFKVFERLLRHDLIVSNQPASVG